jgi:hypothetical protein
MTLKKKAFTATLLCMLASPTFAIFGVGFHWGFDFTTKMTDNANDTVFTLNDLEALPTIEFPGLDIPDLDPNALLMSVSRTKFEATPINFGGKIFIDILPIEFEVSLNMGIWQYDGALTYMNSVEADTSDINDPTVTPQYETIDLTLEEIGGVDFFGVNKTPYGKLNVDLTLKKTFRKKKVFQPSVGVGASLHFATPVLSSEIIKSVINLDDFDPTEEITEEKIEEISNDIIDKIITGGMKPQQGMHFLVGLKVKPPIIPLAIYVDGKYNILFNEAESGLGITTKGFLVNVGIMLNI